MALVTLRPNFVLRGTTKLGWQFIHNDLLKYIVSKCLLNT